MRYFYFSLLMFTSMLWAGNFVSGKFLIPHASALTLTDLRWVLAVAVLIPLVWIREKKLFPPKEAVIPLIFMGITGVVLFNVFIFLALKYTSAFNASLISSLNSIVIAIISFFVLKDRIRSQQIIGMIISFFGVLVVISHGQWSRIVHLHFNRGDLYMLLAVFSWGLFSVAGRKAMQFTSPILSTLWAGVFGLIILVPFNIPSFQIMQPDTTFWIAALYTSIGSTVLAMLFWNIGVQKVGSTQAGMFINFNSIYTAVLAYFLLGEHMTKTMALGTIIVFLGVYIFSATRNKKYKPAIVID